MTATFMLASCCNCNENTEEIQSAKIENFCEVYKTKIENHTYILLYGYYRLALEHDPECPYCKEHGFPEHKLETTDY